jgi:hypothetical protein
MPELTIAGVAGLFVGLAFVGFLFIFTGNGAQSVGQDLGVQQVSDFGNSLTGYGQLIIEILVVLAVMVVVAFVARGAA